MDFWRDMAVFWLPAQSQRLLVSVSSLLYLCFFETPKQKQEQCMGARFSFPQSSSPLSFRDELRHFVDNGTLTHLKVCFSRDTPAMIQTGSPRYVQDNLRLFSKEIDRILLQEKGYFYLCG